MSIVVCLSASRARNVPQQEFDLLLTYWSSHVCVSFQNLMDTQGQGSRQEQIAGTQQIDRCWLHLNFFFPSTSKAAPGKKHKGRF